MSKVIGKQACPICQKNGNDTRGDNLIRYSDGGYHCFACGYHKSPSGYSRILADNSQSSKEISLPSDVEFLINNKGLQWLEQYNLTEKEISDNLIMWSCFRQMLIFPYFDSNKKLLAWQGRCFAPDAKSKWFSQGPLADVDVVIGDGRSHTVIFVEDIVSAIKVGRHVPAMPLFSSELSFKRILRACRRFSAGILWLDPDKRSASILQASRGLTVGFPVSVRVSDHDPKEHDDDEIKQICNLVT